MGSAAVAASLDEFDHRVLGGIPGREAPPAVHLALRHSLGERPARHHAGIRVDDRREVQPPPLARAQVRDVTRELVSGHEAGEVAPHQVGPGLRLGIRDRGALPRVGRASAYPSSRINLLALYRVRPENSPGRKRFTDRKPNLRSESEFTPVSLTL